MAKTELPFNATPLFHLDGTIIDDRKRKVIVNSVGGKSWPDDTHKKALENVKGVVVWGPCKLWYMAQAVMEGQKVKPGYKPFLKPKKFITESYWLVRLEKFNLEILFTKKELEFVQ
jgi:hypothetical protein